MGAEFFTMLQDPAYWENLSRIIPLAVNETIYMVMVSTFLAYVLGVPMGVLLVITSSGTSCPIPGWKDFRDNHQYLPFRTLHYIYL
jgi:ABC-type proline/glycine betaine transport system permease subunit